MRHPKQLKPLPSGACSSYDKNEVWVEWEQFFGRPLAAIQAQWRAAHQLGLVLVSSARTLRNRVTV